MILVILFTLLIIFLFHQFYWRRRNLPPGPLPLPLIGNVLTLYKYQPGYDAYLKWSQEYGPVYSVFLGNMSYVAITDYEVLKKYIMDQGEKFTDRYRMEEFTEMFRGGQYGIVDTDGEFWREQRRFALTALRDLGMGKNIMEQKVLAEVDHMFANIENKNGKIQASKLFTMAVANIINGTLFGYRFDEENESEYWKLRESIHRQQTDFGTVSALLLLTVPALRHLPFFRGMWQKLEAFRDEFFGFFVKQIEKLRNEIDFSSQENTSLVEVYLKEQRRRRNEPDFGGYSEQQLKNIVYDLWIAGLETTSSTLHWGLNFLVNHPEVMEKMHDELDREIGRGRKVELADKNRLNYCQAVIKEVQRFLNLLPSNLLRVAGEDIHIEGHFVAKGTPIMPQISCVLWDEKIFPEPKMFKPERFLNEDGSLKKVPELIPFSLGKRQCAGEGLARLELFLFLTNVVHRYNISTPELPSMARSFKVIGEPVDFECHFAGRD